jgi:hypothetical protein
LNVRDDLLVSGIGLLGSALDPSLDGGRMDLLDAGNRFRAQAFELLVEGALDFLLRRLEVVKGRAIAVTEGSLVLFAANDINHLTALEPVTAVISQLLGSRSAVRTLPGKGVGLDHSDRTLPLTAQRFQRSATEYQKFLAAFN